jgi:hypothetical protein
MTTPPDFGGTEIEEGLQEDLGVIPDKHEGTRPDDLVADPHEDNEAHAPGERCARCGREIQPAEDVRRRADGRWVHEVCPAPGA